MLALYRAFYPFYLAYLNYNFLKISDSQISCCFFHFGQSIYRRIQSLGLAPDYANNLQINFHCKMLVGLAFLPLNSIKEGFRMICRSIEQNNLQGRMDELIDYFLNTYVGSETFGGKEL